MKMNCLATAQWDEIVKTYYKNSDSNVATLHALRGDYGSSNYLTNRQNFKEI